MPGAWYLAAIILIFTRKSFVAFRIAWALVQFFFLTYIGKTIKKENSRLYPYYLWFIISYPLLSIFFWNHLFLADSLASLIGAGIIWLLISQINKKSYNKRILFIISILTFTLLFTSLTYIYFAAIVYLWVMLLFIKTKPKRSEIINFIFYSALPYLIYLIYLLTTGSFKYFWFSNFTYNTKLYISIPNYTRGQHFNPLKMALTIIFNFHHHFWPALTRIGSLDFYLPITQTLTLAVLILFLFLIKNNLLYGILYFFLVSFSAPRSNLEALKETDYQSAMFVIIGATSFFVAIYLLKKLKFSDQIEKLALNIGIILLVVYGFFTLGFLLKNSYEKLFYIYTQKMPRIYDRDFAAEFIDSVINQGDIFWIGPYEPHREFFVKKGRLPGKYPTLLPQFRENNYLKEDFIKQFQNNPPKIIIFKHEASIFMTPAPEFGKFFLEFLEQNYVRVKNINKVSVKKSPSEFNLSEDLYIRKDVVKEVVNKLKRLGYLSL